MTTYITQHAIIHAEQANVIFLWQYLPKSIHPFVSIPCFAVRFRLSTTILHGTLNLSSLLLRFTSLHRPLTQQNAQLLDVSFYATLHTITSVMIFDSSLKSAYNSILTRAREDPFFMEHQTSLPMLTWPNSARGMTLLTDSDCIQELITTTE